jgi:hypothetical protein
MSKSRTTDLRSWLWHTAFSRISEHSSPHSRKRRSVVPGKRKLSVWGLNLVLFFVLGHTPFAAEKLVGLQSAPSIAMALPWFAEEARLYPKYDLDFQLVYIASSGIVTAAMSGGSGSVAIVGGEGPIRAYLSGNTDFVFIGSVKNVLTHSIMGKPDIKRPEDLKGKRIGVGRIGGNSHYFTQNATERSRSPQGCELDSNRRGAGDFFGARYGGRRRGFNNDTAGHARGVSGIQLRHRRP